ncbi:hypothetical protein AGMMS50267_00510 [Spirochaetia bacterium]|nr:hypothetical protein AGMMS50267_00510 [Spirochaetia bacterium]
MNIIDSMYTVLADILGLSIFSPVRESPLLTALRDLLEDMSEEKAEGPVFSLDDIYPDIIQDWAAFTAAFVLCQKDYSFYLTIAHLTVTDDNPYTHAAEIQDTLPPVLAVMAKTDLARLGRIAAFEIHSLGFHIAELLRKIGLDQIAQGIEEESRVIWAAEHPTRFPTAGKKPQVDGAELLLKIFPENSNWGASLPALTEHIRTHGAGLLGQYASFYWAPPDTVQSAQTAQASWFFALTPAFLSLSLRPVQNPDPIRPAHLYGYEDQRSTVIANTLRFLEGNQANNLLLYGDRGTGKSATVKAVCNEYSDRGLKLLEISKADLVQLPGILDMLADRALRFVIFIDDLSFETTDDSFRSLKALLEGGIETRPANVVVYATSNRRHLVKERIADRPNSAEAASAAESGTAAATGDIRAFDTMQEQFSLADRFGLTVVYTAPGQEEYLRIAECIAEQRGLLTDASTAEERLRFRDNALRWERWFNGRSPRTAVQYVDWVAGAANSNGTIGSAGKFPWE